MDEKKVERGETVIDLQRLFGAVLNKAWLIAAVAVLCAVLTFLGTLYLIPPKYEASAMFYVNNSNIDIGNVSVGITSSDISASKNLVKSYIVILNTRESLNSVIDYAGSNRTYGELKGMINAASVDNTEIFRVVVTSTDPQEATDLANAIAYILPKRISTIIEGTSAKVVDAAVIPSTPSSPNYTQNTVIGFLAGLLVTLVVIALKEIFDITVRTEEDIQQCCNHPVLAAVPDMAAPSKGGKYYYYGYGNKGKTHTPNPDEAPKLIGSSISFAASEAYKLLRTKLQFSFSDERNSRVIGVSSALTGEGKSLSSVNLAYMLSQLDKKVILIDCDMRRPSLAAKLPIQKTPGLSAYLSGQVHMADLIQKCGIEHEEDAFHVVAAGRRDFHGALGLELTLYVRKIRPTVIPIEDARGGRARRDGLLSHQVEHHLTDGTNTVNRDSLHHGGLRRVGLGHEHFFFTGRLGRQHHAEHAVHRTDSARQRQFTDKAHVL